MKKILPIIILAISLCLSSVENSVMAANVDFAFQQERSNSITVGDKNYSFDWSYNSSTVRFLCENKNGKISVIKNIPVNKFGFPSGCTPSINVCGKYGNYIYFWGSGELDECGFFRISVKSGKLSLIEYGMNYAQMLKKRYIILYGDTGGDYSPYRLMVYDAKTQKKKILNEQTGHSFEKGRYVYYSKVPVDYYPVGVICKAKIYRYDVVTGKTTTLAKSVKLSDIYEINNDYMAYRIDPETFKVLEFSGGQKVTPKDGEYTVICDKEYFNEDKLASYGAKINKNTLTIYGSYQTKGKNDTKAKGMYKFNLSSSYKIRVMEDEEVELVSASQFNSYNTKTYYGCEMILTVKNKKVTEITLLP